MVHRSPFPAVDLPEIPFTSYVFAEAHRRSDHVAIINGDTGATLTYRELVGAIRRMAAGLAAAGLRKGDVCAIYSPNLPEYAVSFYGIAMAGGVVTPVNPQYSVTELTHQLRDAGARFLITTPRLLRRAQQGARSAMVERIFTIGEAKGATPLSALLEAGGDPPRVTIDPIADVVALPYSSGTTGLAKGVMLTHFSVVANLQQMTAVERIGADERLIATLPFYHIYGMIMVMTQGLRCGATLVTLSEFKARRLLEIIEKYRITTAYLVPPLVRTLATHTFAGFDLSSLRDIISSAAPLPESIARACGERLHCVVRQAYGLTETSPLTHVTPRHRARTSSVGVAIPNTEFRLVDVRRRTDVPAGRLGEVWVRGPQVMKGYLHNPEATTSMIDRDGWLHTGDIGFIDKDGDLNVVDRAKELVKFRGLHYGEHELLSSMVDDIAARRQAHERATFQALLLDSVRESVVATDARHRVTFWNRGAEALFGYPAAAAVGQPVDALIIPPMADVKARWMEEFAEVQRSGKWQGAALRRRRDGSTFWTDLVVSKVADLDSDASGFIAIHRDITELRRNEEMLTESREQLRNLASSLMDVREEERTTISRELHDELGQALTRLKIDLSWLIDSLPPARRTPRALSMARLVDGMVEKVQHISAQLRPAILDDLGLEAAIESHVKDFASWNGCRCALDLAIGDLAPRRDRDTAVFRIVQESLTNVARHGHASRVSVRARVAAGMLTVEVEDNGIGIPDEKLASAESLGLLGMRERADMVRGTLSIRRRARNGTVVTLSVPIVEAAEPAPRRAAAVRSGVVAARAKLRPRLAAVSRRSG
jgi:PAS domain S-box-containing protein